MEHVDGTLYGITFDKNPPRIIEERKTLAQLEEEYGPKVIGRAQVLAAMDCLMHHLKDGRDLEVWMMSALPDKYNWDILDWDPGEASRRTEDYVKEVAGMSDKSFHCIVYTFADIVRGQCFDMMFKRGAFDYVNGTTEKEKKED